VEPNADGHRVLGALRRALAHGDGGSVATLLDVDVQLLIDGGGTVSVAEPPLTGVRAVSDRLCRLVAASPLPEIDLADVNGAPGLVLRRGDTVIGIVGIQTTRGLITTVFVVLSPTKLEIWNRIEPGQIEQAGPTPR
jgi:hypothetical protein